MPEHPEHSVLDVRPVTALTVDQTDAVLDLVRRAEAVDGVAPLNEAELLDLRYPDGSTSHLLATGPDGVLGYARLEPGPEMTSGAVVVDPRHRGRGLGGRLFDALRSAAGTDLRIWAQGDAESARRLAGHAGWTVRRELLVLARDLDGGWPEPELPSGIKLRSFRPGEDEQAWLEVNSRAFAGHPEQGRTTATDLGHRVAESWFDPAGFLLAVRGSELVGFHWTKQHPHRVGEVYVLGVDPHAGIRGLGGPLLAAGLGHLRTVGCSTVLLYVEADNEPALRLYRRFGFQRVRSDVMYGPPEQG